MVNTLSTREARGARTFKVFRPTAGTDGRSSENHTSHARAHAREPDSDFSCPQLRLQLLCQGLRQPYAAEVPPESQKPGDGRLPAQQAALRLGVAQLSPVSMRSCDCWPHHQHARRRRPNGAVQEGLIFLAVAPVEQRW